MSCSSPSVLGSSEHLAFREEATLLLVISCSSVSFCTVLGLFLYPLGFLHPLSLQEELLTRHLTPIFSKVSLALEPLSMTVGSSRFPSYMKGKEVGQYGASCVRRVAYRSEPELRRFLPPYAPIVV